MIRNIFKAPPDPKGINPTDAASNDTMTKSKTQTATEAHQAALVAELEGATHA